MTTPARASRTGFVSPSPSPTGSHAPRPTKPTAGNTLSEIDPPRAPSIDPTLGGRDVVLRAVIAPPATLRSVLPRAGAYYGGGVMPGERGVLTAMDDLRPYRVRASGHAYGPVELWSGYPLQFGGQRASLGRPDGGRPAGSRSPLETCSPVRTCPRIRRGAMWRTGCSPIREPPFSPSLCGRSGLNAAWVRRRTPRCHAQTSTTVDPPTVC